MAKKIRWSRQANEFILNNVRSLRKKSALLKVISLLSDYPEMYPKAGSRHYAGCRSITTVFPFVIIYRVKEHFVEVMAILEGRRKY